MTKDYRSTGDRLKTYWLSVHRRIGEELREGLKNATLGPEWDFTRALYQHAGGDSSYLIAYARSERPIYAEHREQWAQVLEGVLTKPKKKRGRPRSPANDAAFGALGFFRAWQEANRAAGINDWGSREKMREEAARFWCEELEPSSPPLKIEAVLELMSRPGRRRHN